MIRPWCVPARPYEERKRVTRTIFPPSLDILGKALVGTDGQNFFKLQIMCHGKPGHYDLIEFIVRFYIHNADDTPLSYYFV